MLLCNGFIVLLTCFVGCLWNKLEPSSLLGCVCYVCGVYGECCVYGMCVVCVVCVWYVLCLWCVWCVWCVMCGMLVL